MEHHVVLSLHIQGGAALLRSNLKVMIPQTRQILLPQTRQLSKLLLHSNEAIYSALQKNSNLWQIP